MNLCQDRNITIEKKWTDQSSRLSRKLLPEHFRIDEKTLADFVLFAASHGKQIVYFNNSNRPDGDWAAFFRDDPAVSVILLAALDTDHWQRRCTETIRNADGTADQHKKTDALKDLVSLATEIFAEVERITANVHEYRGFQEQLIKYVNTRLSPYFQLVLETNKILRKDHGWENPHHITFDITFGRYWFADRPYTFEKTDDWPGSALLTLGNNLPRMIHDIFVLKKEARIFLEESVLGSGNVKPHIALFIAFCSLYRHAQGKLNHINERHLDHYYQDILRFHPAPGTRDSVYLAFNVANDAGAVVLDAGTKFTYTGSGDEEPGHFITTSPLSLHEGRIREIRAVNISELKWSRSFLHRSNLPSTVYDLRHARENVLEAGFGIRSDYLKLEEGDRRITFDFTIGRLEAAKLKERFKTEFGTSDTALINEHVSGCWEVRYSGPEGPVRFGENDVTVLFRENPVTETMVLNFDLLAKRSDPPIVSHDANDPAASALLRFTLSEKGSSRYTLFRDLLFQHARLGIQVIGVRDLILHNDFGRLENAHPFEPFGPRPTMGSAFYVGHRDILLKPLTDLVLNLEWYNLPLHREGFKGYYRGYEGIEDNSSFKVTLASLKDKSWVPAENRQVVDLFTDAGKNSRGLSAVRRVNEIDVASLQLNEGAAATGPVDDYNVASTDGFIKLELCYPDTAFGHDQYGDLVQRSAYKAVKDKNEPGSINEPYTPTLKNVSLEYASVIDIQKWDKKISLFTFHAFASETQEGPGPWGLLPYVPDGGSVFVDLDSRLCGKEISLLFRIGHRSKGAVEVENSVSMLFDAGSGWVPLSHEKITHDGTHKLERTGIMRIRLPEATQDDFGNVLPDCWLRLDFDDPHTANNIEAIHLNAGIATREFPLAPGSSLLPAETLVAFAEPALLVESVSQPFASFGGQKPESREEFRTRVSERLNHKGRAVSNRDFANLLLSHFPAIQSLKCLNHLDRNLKFSPGACTVAVIPASTGEQEPLERYFPTEQLRMMQSFLETRAFCGMRVSVVNAVYERTRLKFTVRFRQGYDDRSSIKRLRKMIRGFLNPWTSPKIIRHGGAIPVTTILNEIELQEYVDFVTNFSVFHIVNGQVVNLSASPQNDLIVRAGSPVSVLIPDHDHKILLYNEDRATDKPGINDMMIGNDFLVKDPAEGGPGGLGFDRIGRTFRLRKDEGENQTGHTK